MENKMIIAETERLVLRRYKKEDLQDLFEYLSDKEVVEYEPYRPLAHLRKNVYFWKDENENPIWKDTYIYAKLNADQ